MSDKFIVYVHDRAYSVVEYTDAALFEKVIPARAPPPADILAAKIFNRDLITFEDPTAAPALAPRVIHSPVRTTPAHAGVLVIADGKTYGFSANRRPLYKCIPDEKQLPAFLVPYEPRVVGFSKNRYNKFVLFRFMEWKDRYPVGQLTEVLGDVNELPAFYEYQLYRKSLQVSMTRFIKMIKTSLGAAAAADTFPAAEICARYGIAARTPVSPVFTIDNTNTSDFDDAFSAAPAPDGGAYVSVYITNVAVILDFLDLWAGLTRRVSSIYLPDKRRPMIPSILSEHLCSLRAGSRRICFVMDLELDAAGAVRAVAFDNVLVEIAANYTYSAPPSDESYDILYRMAAARDRNVKSAADVVAHWMTTINTLCGAELAARGAGIFRCVGGGAAAAEEAPPHLDEDSRRVIAQWKQSSGTYVLGAPAPPDHYAHISSPIRRIVDLLNQIIMFGAARLSAGAGAFLENWSAELDYINTSFRNIRKIQRDCDILYHVAGGAAVAGRQYEGVVFDEVQKVGGGYSYVVYLREIRMISKITVADRLNVYGIYLFEILVFEKEDTLVKKCKLGFLGGEKI